MSPATARTYQVDVGNATAVDEFAAKVRQDFKRASLLINHAGVALHGAFSEISLADMEWLFRINFWGVVHGCKSFLPLLQQEPESHIVNLSSVYGLFGPPAMQLTRPASLPCGFTEVLRQELKSTNIHVSCVHPAEIQTAIADNARLGHQASLQEAVILRERFKKLAPTSPAQAAGTILKGILRDRQRILIGADAYRIDIMLRLAPSRGLDALISMMGKRAPVPATLNAKAR